MNDIKFKTDNRYIVVYFLKFIAYYIISLLFVLCFKPKDPLGFFGASLLSCITIYVGLFNPGSIIVRNGIISFKRTNSYARTEVEITNIARVETSSSLFNTLKIFTKAGDTYNLHPKELTALEKYLNNGFKTTI